MGFDGEDTDPRAQGVSIIENARTHAREDLSDRRQILIPLDREVLLDYIGNKSSRRHRYGRLRVQPLLMAIMIRSSQPACDARSI